MKVNKKFVILATGLIAVVAILLYTIPVYSKSVRGCEAQDTYIHKSLLFGSDKEEIESEASDLIEQSSKYDCDIHKVTYKLFIL